MRVRDDPRTVRCPAVGRLRFRRTSWPGCETGCVKTLFPVEVLGALFRGKLLAALDKALRRGELAMPGGEAADPEAWDRLRDRLHRKRWNAGCRRRARARLRGAARRADRDRPAALPRVPRAHPRPTTAARPAQSRAPGGRVMQSPSRGSGPVAHDTASRGARLCCAPRRGDSVVRLPHAGAPTAGPPSRRRLAASPPGHTRRASRSCSRGRNAASVPIEPAEPAAPLPRIGSVQRDEFATAHGRRAARRASRAIAQSPPDHVN